MGSWNRVEMVGWKEEEEGEMEGERAPVCASHAALTSASRRRRTASGGRVSRHARRPSAAAWSALAAAATAPTVASSVEAAAVAAAAEAGARLGSAEVGARLGSKSIQP